MRLLRGIGGRVLACGCLVGVYETYAGTVIASIDAPGSSCHRPDHRLHELVSVSEADGPPPYPSPSQNGRSA